MTYLSSLTKKKSDQNEAAASENVDVSEEINISKETKLEIIDQVNKESLDANYPERKGNKDWQESRYEKLLEQAIEEAIATQKRYNQVIEESNDPAYPERKGNKEWAKKRQGELLLAPIEALLAEREKEAQTLSEIIKTTRNIIEDLNSKKELYSSDLTLPKVSLPVVEATIVNPTTETKTAELSFSRKIAHDTYQGYDVKASLTSDGKLSVIDKNTKQDLSKNFTVLYLDKDNKIKDQNGKIVTLLENDFSKVSADYYANKIDKDLLNAKGLSGLQAGQLNNFRHNGKQVIFAKATDAKTADAVVKQDEKQDIKKDEVKQTQSKQPPWSKVTYHELENGLWMTKDAYVRKSLDNNKKEILEVFVGKDANGKDIWKDAKTVNHPKLNLVSYSKSSGEFFNQNGEKIFKFDTTESTVHDANNVKNLINNSPDKLFTLKSDKFNNLLVQGRRPVFIEIP